MEVVAPTATAEFRLAGDPFDYFYHYASAPTSPTRAAAIYGHFKSSSEIPTAADGGDEVFEFTFFSGPIDRGAGLPPAPIPADELFEAGKIRPLKLPPRLQLQPTTPPRQLSPRSPKRRSRVGDVADPFAVALANVANEVRGREIKRAPPAGGPPSPSIPISPRAASRRRRGTRSLSPFREDIDIGASCVSKDATSVDTSTSVGASGSHNCIAKFFKKRTNNWRLRDLLLFRRAGRTRTSKVDNDNDGYHYLLRSYASGLATPPVSPPGGKSPRALAAARWPVGVDSRGSSFRSVDGGGRGRSAHETHYAASKAAAEEQRRKTPLPYRQGVFAFLRNNPALQAVSRSFNSATGTAATTARTTSFPS